MVGGCIRRAQVDLLVRCQNSHMGRDPARGHRTVILCHNFMVEAMKDQTMGLFVNVNGLEGRVKDGEG